MSPFKTEASPVPQLRWLYLKQDPTWASKAWKAEPVVWIDLLNNSSLLLGSQVLILPGFYSHHPPPCAPPSIRLVHWLIQELEPSLVCSFGHCWDHSVALCSDITSAQAPALFLSSDSIAKQPVMYPWGVSWGKTIMTSEKTNILPKIPLYLFIVKNVHCRKIRGEKKREKKL